MPEPQRTPTDDQPLTFGGTLSLTQTGADDYRLRIARDEEEPLDLRLSALDLWGIRARTGDLVRGRMTATAEAGA